jgi:DNA-binding transcriptional ArsR family regulator
MLDLCILTGDQIVTFNAGVDDDVFRALADPGRRHLLDRLFERDAQTLGELCGVLPGMTRFGVMKHLTVLEDAHLVTSRRLGRVKLHYLNPVPIREVHDRWISKFAEPWAAAMVDLKKELEGEPTWPDRSTSSRPTSRRRPSASGKR